MPRLHQFPSTQLAGVLPADDDLSMVGSDLPANDAQQRGFSAAARAHNCGHLTLWHLQIEAIEDQPLTTEKAQIADFNGIFFGHEWAAGSRGATIPPPGAVDANACVCGNAAVAIG